LKTIWQITHSCGHQVQRDLSGRASDRRASFAEWLAKQECTDCWRAAKEGDEQDKAAWLEAKRAEEQAESEAWSEQFRMPPLETAAEKAPAKRTPPRRPCGWRRRESPDAAPYPGKRQAERLGSYQK
jgi:hypothetical protein